MDPNQPFEERSEHVPGGILATYKKRLNLSARDVMEQDYWENIKDLDTQSAKYFSTVSQNERELMNQTKNFVQRLRLDREIDFTDDFRKRFMTREYGNYDKYDKNKIVEDVEKG